MEKRKNKNGIIYVVISLLVCVTVAGGLVFAGGGSSQNVNVNSGGVYNYNENDSNFNPVDEPTLGAFPGGDIYTPVTFYDKVGYGEGRNRMDTFHLIKSFADATNTAVVFNPDAEGYNDFYLDGLWLENSGKATSTNVRICVTTSTALSIAKDDSAYLTEDAGSCTLMRTLGNVFGADGAAFDSMTATSSFFSAGVYPGSNTQVINNDWGILINSTTNILVYATSTGDDSAGIKLPGNTFDGKLHIIGHESNR